MRHNLKTLVLAYAEEILKRPEVTLPSTGPWVRCFLKSSVLGKALCRFIVACAFVVISTNDK